MNPVNDFDKFFRPNPMIKKPINGNNGTRYDNSKAFFIKKMKSDVGGQKSDFRPPTSVFKSVQKVYIYRMNIPVHHYDDR